MALAMLTFAAVVSPAAAARREGGGVTVSFDNKSDRDVTLAGDNQTNGCLTSSLPTTITAGDSASWTTGSCGDPDGSAGTVSFRIAGEGNAMVEVGWNSPVAGPNTYTQTAPNTYVISHSGGGGANATVTFTFDCDSTTCDGIPDNWKRDGVTITPGDGSPPQFIDLPAMGASVNKPDIFVQVDWMADTTHSHQLDSEAIRKVVEAFKDSPYHRHSPTTGINLHVDAGPTSILNFDTNATWGSLSKARKLTETTNLGTKANGLYQWDAFNKIKTEKGGFVSTGRASIFHYAISAHNLEPGSTSSGISAGTPGSDFIVSLGSFANQVGTVNEQAGTFMHELGHNLGLRHGGDADGPNYKPQYLSVMNYAYQFGLSTDSATGLFDYSRDPGDLDEKALNENRYPFSSRDYNITHWCPNSQGGGRYEPPVNRSLGWVDWNCDGKREYFRRPEFDVNGDGQITTLTGHDDWSNLWLRGGSVGRPGASNGVPAPTPDDELTPQEAAMELPPDTKPPVTTATTRPAADKKHYFTTDVTVTLTARDDISGVARTEYKLDRAGWSDYTGPIRLTTDGRHELLYRSIDHAQNREADKSLTLRIDCKHDHAHSSDQSQPRTP